ncbi:type II toxin-antitoxin system RelE/ParE family toxin [Rhizobacter sp. SG703]|uniref:type II toxin-antitoxin system RelE/ParE family toxin n=1 Tax=Rhizobacter sp. SG703 TaxID=2587140 RepID=UPI0014460ED3|nr:type II toxin-antitoxin system RelE/ParE family toxin [Rhizobacter sp. SG703]NKI96841.1 phage-related protein [Rhizobacter sp. SG703]
MVKETTQKTPLAFYRSAGGAEPVREWLKALDLQDRAAVGQDLMRAQWRWPVGMPLCRAMGQGLWEIRTQLPSQRIARVLICQEEGVLVALHAFIKKTQKTPDDELALARRRHKELKS